jgi:hypothetical protein
MGRNWGLATALGAALAVCAPLTTQADVITVQATADIFAAGLSAVPDLEAGGGTLPPWVAVTPGALLQIAASGSISWGDPSRPSGPGGQANPFHGGPPGTFIEGYGAISGFSDPDTSFGLVGVFTGPDGEVGDIFLIGTQFSIIVPLGATRIYLGIPDAEGFIGKAGFYGDNSGSFLVSVVDPDPTAVPEPGTAALFLSVLIGLGLVLVFAGNSQGTSAKLRAIPG